MTERILIDTGPMVALFSEDDEHHQRCRDALTTLIPPLFTCWPVVTESAWLLRTRPRSLYQLFDSFDGGMFALLTLDAKDLPAVKALMKRYEDSGIQFADAALAHLAEARSSSSSQGRRTQIGRIAKDALDCSGRSDQS